MKQGRVLAPFDHCLILLLLPVSIGQIRWCCCAADAADASADTVIIDANHRRDEIVNALVDHGADRTVMNRQGTAQYRSVEFLSQDDEWASTANISYDDLTYYERYAAAVVYYASGIDDSSCNHHADSAAASWLSTGFAICDWYGIACNEHGSVLEINTGPGPDTAQCVTMTGVLAEEVTVFKNSIEVLSMQGCGLKGSIPSALGLLTRLVNLNVANNNLTGRLPREVGNLDKLRILRFGWNHLDGTILSNLFRVTQLQWLDLEQNKFTGTIPKQIRKLQNLHWLSLRGNVLSGRIPPSIGTLQALDELELDGNHLSGKIPSSLGNLTAIWKLDVHDNRLRGTIPTELGNLHDQLQYLHLERNKLRGRMPTEICDLHLFQLTADVERVKCHCCNGVVSSGTPRYHPYNTRVFQKSSSDTLKE